MSFFSGIMLVMAACPSNSTSCWMKRISKTFSGQQRKNWDASQDCVAVQSRFLLLMIVVGKIFTCWEIHWRLNKRELQGWNKKNNIDRKRIKRFKKKRNQKNSKKSKKQKNHLHRIKIQDQIKLRIRIWILKMKNSVALWAYMEQLQDKMCQQSQV